ncbi:MAG TPA: DUF4288 domain-containing protein [Gemmatimonadaceae bacterium]|nr:DUF4288 domain-containing protein [Gemmatimonadaceae bacterium]
MKFYSARLLYIILIDRQPRRRNEHDETVVLFRARDFEHAFTRALELGRAAETQYLNAYGQAVRWALVEVVTLDCVGGRVDGREVASKLHARTASKPVAFNSRFRPERSRPNSSF